jgi:Tol biopolymer transport system component/serine/threonine protein kinase
MNLDRWQLVKELLNEALTKRPSERSQFLDEHCAGDPEMRAELVSLLASYDDAGDFMDSEDGAATAAARAPDTGGGTCIGRYRVLEEIGRGGMGAVYKAVRTDDGSDAFVAIKVVKRGMDHDYILTRFRHERQILAALNHPNVAQLLDGGATDEGLPYFVMEYIEGKPITAYCDDHQLTTRERVEMFRLVCSAVQSAHDRKVVHRDIKPGNILVKNDGQPKLLDFGIAKILDPDLATHTLDPTATVLRLMTPEYASPEQVRGDEITSASDVYSLGVLLYELLTGHRPYRLKTRLPHEVAHIICDEAPEKPSTMVGKTELITRGTEGPITLTPEVVSSARRSRPEELRRTLSGDLDNIILMAMRKEPARRYSCAGELREELDRYLEGRPVRARKDTAFYRARKAMRRNRTLIAASTVALLLGAAMVFVWRQYIGPALSSGTTGAIVTPLTSFPGDETQPVFSPDGTRIAFVWDGENGDNSDIYIKPVRGVGIERLTTNEAEDVSPTWSPDGRHIAWLRVSESDTSIFFASAVPGAVHGRITSVYPNRIEAVGRHLDWSPDGKYLAAADRRGPDEPFRIVLVEMATGHKIQLTNPPGGTVGDSCPAYSPDGKTVSFIRAVSSGVDDLFVAPVSGGEARRVTDDRRYIISQTWSADGASLLFSSNRAGNHALWRVPVQGGTPERVLNVGYNASDPVFSRDGKLMAYSQFYQDANIWEMQLGSRAARKIISSTQYDSSPHVSPDGRQMAFRSSRSGSNEIWIANIDGSGPRQLTSFRNTLTGTPRWSPDGRKIAFDSRPEGQPEIFVIDVDGNNLKRITNEPAEDVVPSWSRDGQRIYFASNRGGTWQVWWAPSEGGTPQRLTRSGGFAAFESLDGRYVYYAKGRSVPGLWRVKVDGSGEEAVLDRLKAGLWGYWGLTPQGILFVDREALSSSYAFHMLPYGAAEPYLVADIEKPVIPADSGMGVVPGGRSVLYSQVDQSGSDVLMLENPVTR